MNRTDKPVLGFIGLSQRVPYYARTVGYSLSTENQYWRMYWHRTGSITLYQYWLSRAGWILANQYLNRIDNSVLGFVGHSQRVPYYARIAGYRRSTGNQYWRMYWHNTGMIPLHQYWAYTDMPLLANEFLNRTDKPVLGLVGPTQRVPYYARTAGYGRGTGHQHWHLYWHNTGMITLRQYWLVGTGWVLIVSTDQYWAYVSMSLLASQ